MPDPREQQNPILSALEATGSTLLNTPETAGRALLDMEPAAAERGNPVLHGIGAVGRGLSAIPAFMRDVAIGPSDDVSHRERLRRIVLATLVGGQPGALANLQADWAKQDALTRAAAADPIIQQRISQLTPSLGPRGAFEHVAAENPSLQNYRPQYRPPLDRNATLGLPSPASLATGGRGADAYRALEPTYDAVAQAKQGESIVLPPTETDHFKLNLETANGVAQRYRQAGRKVRVQADTDGKAGIVIDDDTRRTLLPADEIVRRGLIERGYRAIETESPDIFQIQAPPDLREFAGKEATRSGARYLERTGDPSQLPPDARPAFGAGVSAGGSGLPPPAQSPLVTGGGRRVGTDELDLRKHSATTAIDTRAAVDRAGQIQGQKDRGQIEDQLAAAQSIRDQLEPLVDAAFPRSKTPPSSGSTVVDMLPDMYAIQQRARFAATKTTDDNAAQQQFAAQAQHALGILAKSLGMRPGPRASEQLEGSLYQPGDSAEQVHARLNQVGGFKQSQLREWFQAHGWQDDTTGAAAPQDRPAIGPRGESNYSTQELEDAAKHLGITFERPGQP